MMKLSNWAVAGLLSVFSLAVKAADGKSFTIPLKAKSGMKINGGYKVLSSDKDMNASMPFAIPPGTLNFKYSDGKLIPDLNLDGQITNADGSGFSLLGETFSIPVTVHGKSFSYELRVTVPAWNDFALEGKTALIGIYEGKTVTVRDGNLNGKFNDPLDDTISIGDMQIRALQTPVTNIGGDLLQLSFDQENAALHLSEYNGKTVDLLVKSGKEGWVGTCLLVERDGLFSTVVRTGETIKVIPGDYFVRDACFRMKNGDGYLSGAGRTLIPIGKDSSELTIGAPFTLSFIASRSKKDPANITYEDVELIDAAGISYEAAIYGHEDSTLVGFVKAGSKRKSLSKLEY